MVMTGGKEYKKKLEKKIDNFISTEIDWIPLNNVEILENKKEEIIKFLDHLDDDDDVQNVYTNIKFKK